MRQGQTRSGYSRKRPAPRTPRTLLGRCAAAVLALAATCGGAEPQQQRVLILQSFGRDFAPFSVMSSAFRTELARQAPVPIEFYEASLETAHFSRGEVEGAVTEYLRVLFAHRRPDLVVTVAEPATLFAARQQAELFPDIPLLASVEERSAGLAPATNATVFSTRIDLPELLANILQVLPATTNVVMIIGQSPFEQFWTEECRREFAAFSNRLSVTYLNDLPLERICERVAALPSRSAVLYAMLTVDAAGVPYERNQGLRRVWEVSTAPIFGVFEQDMGNGIVGGRLLSFESIGRRLAQPALRLLAGEPPWTVVTPRAGVSAPQYDWRELRRWSIAAELLPPDSEVRFREPTQWEQHRWQILGAIAVCMVEAVLIIALILQLRRRRRAEAAARKSADWLSLATASARIGIWEWDFTSNAIDATAECKRLLGWGPGQAVDFPMFLDRVHPDDRPTVRTEVDASVRNRTAYDTQYRIVLPGGETRWIAACGRCRYSRDRAAGMIGAVMDVTARKQAEYEAQRHRQELAHATRLSMMGELAASLAHELNQPLAAILSNAQAARRFLAAPDTAMDDIRAILDDIIRDDKRAGDVIHHLRALVEKRPPANAEVTDLNDVVRDAARLLNSERISRNVDLALDLEPQLAPVLAGRVELLQVLLNLMVNAMDALREQPAGARRMRVTTTPVQGGVRVEVRDSGPGIPPDLLPDIFRPFFTTKSHGLGMGLAISRSLVEPYDGILTAGNHPEGGAEFRLELPAAPPAFSHE